ncbi:MAG: hypothetical protein ACTHN5_18805 [Phycisphaerae bacterium]
MKSRRERQRGMLIEGLESRVLLSTAHVAGVADHIVFKSRPGNQSAGSKFGFTVAVVDSNGNTVTSDKDMVTLTFAGPTGGMVNGTKKVALHNGVGTFSGLSLTGPGAYRLRVTDTVENVTTRSPLAVGVAGLVITTQPTAGGWQSAGTLTVGDPVRQVQGNVTVTGIYLGNAGGNLTIEMNGNGTFDTSHVITDTATGGTMTPMFLAPASVSTSAANLTILPPSSWTFSHGTFTVGDTVQQTSSNGTVSGTGVWLGTLNGNYTIGVASGRFTSPGTITDTNSSAVLSASASNATSVSGITISELPTLVNFANGTAGSKVNVVATFVGADGMTVVRGNHSKVSLAIAAGSGAGSTLATVTALNGVATFRNVALTRAGVYSLKAVSGKQSSLATGALTINAGVPARLKIVSTFPPDTATKRPTGSLGPIVVDIVDSFGNVVTAPSQLTLTASTTKGWTANGTLSVNDKLSQTSNGTVTATGTFLGTDASGNFLVGVTTGQFSNTLVINDTTSGATLTPTNAAAFPSSDSAVTAVLNTTLQTTTTPGKITQAANGTATSVNGTATITLTSSGGTAGPNLGLKPGYYTLIVSDGTLVGQRMQVYVR